MYVVTYSLRDNDANSDSYYCDAAIFTEEVLSEFENLTHEYVKKYVSYLRTRGERDICSEYEYSLELLVMGTLWQVYSGDAEGLQEIPGHVLSNLAKIRLQGGTLKPGIDFIRGIMATLFLSPDLYDNNYTLEATPGHLNKLIIWLSATGEFRHEVKRLEKWKEFLQCIPEKEASDIIATSLTLAAWFDLRSNEVLGKYTKNVDRYLNEIRPGRYWREDVIFCGRRRVEYHLNMVGAEILNRAFKKSFIATKRKLILIPSCLKLLPQTKCKAVETEFGTKCSLCTHACMAASLTRIGKGYGFDVMMVSHGSSISASKSINKGFGDDTGVVGVACVLNLISGGWKLKELGIPAQCVLLDYCGCKNHWTKEGLPTELNLRQLKRILGI